MADKGQVELPQSALAADFFMEFSFNISFTTDSYASKPASPNKLRFVRVKECDIDMLADHVSRGYGFCGDFGFDYFPIYGHKTYANFIGANLVSVDFDGCPVPTLEKLVESCKIKPFIAYETYSHLMEGKGNRYRLVFAFVERITTPQAFKDAHRWLCGSIENSEALGIDTTSASAVQVMYGTTPDRELLKVGNVIEGVSFEGPDDWLQRGGGANVYRDEIDAYLKEKWHGKTPIELVEKYKGQNIPIDVKFVSDQWLIENGYAVRIDGILWRGRNKGYQDGEGRRRKLYVIIKGLTRLNRNVSFHDMLHYAFCLSSRIFIDKLSEKDIIEQTAHAYYDARHNDPSGDIPKGWRRKRGYRMVSGRKSWPLDYQSYAALNISSSETTDPHRPVLLGTPDPDRYVLCTEAEADTNIGGFWFFVRDTEKHSHYTKVKKHIEGLDSFKAIMDEYEGKRSKRKVAEWLRSKGYAVDNNKLTEWLKVV